MSVLDTTACVSFKGLREMPKVLCVQGDWWVITAWHVAGWANLSPEKTFGTLGFKVVKTSEVFSTLSKHEWVGGMFAAEGWPALSEQHASEILDDLVERGHNRELRAMHPNAG